MGYIDFFKDKKGIIEFYIVDVPILYPVFWGQKMQYRALKNLHFVGY